MSLLDALPGAIPDADRRGAIAIMTLEAQSELYQALKAHKSKSQITRACSALGSDLEVLDRRIEAARCF